MAVIEGGVSGALAEVGVGAAVPQHITAKPIPYGSLGHYRYAGFTGILPAALAANSEIFQFRWSDATRLCAILEVVISASVSTTMFAAGVPVQIDMIKATGWTAVGTGGTRPAFATTDKMRTSMGSTLLGANDVGIATTAALGAGTKTLEANSMATIAAAGPITGSLIGTIIPPNTSLYDADMESGEHPLLLVQNEGFVIRSVAVPATGTWTASISVKWAELTLF